MNRRSLLACGAVVATAGLANHSGKAQEEGSLAWSELTQSEATPAARYDHSLTASNRDRLLVLFGGRDGGGGVLGDTWLYRRGPGEWEEVSTAGPSARFGHAVAADGEAGITYLFGGQAGDIFYNDLWAFDAAEGAWSLVHDGSGTAPTPRYGTSLVRTNSGGLLMSHGFTFSGRFNDTWSWDEDEGWVEVSPPDDSQRPLNRCLHESIWDSSAGVMLLYGGCSSGYGPCPQGDLWRFDPAKSTWTLLAPQAAPAGRMNPALVHDAGREQTLLIGGLTESGYDAGVWKLTDVSEPAWAHVDAPAGPSPRASHDVCVTGPHLYLFGGISDSGVMSDLWTIRLDGA